MNPYYYLFYKLTQFLNKKGDNEWGPIGAVTFFIECNIIPIYVNIFRVFELNINDAQKKTILIIIFTVLFITNAILFLNKKRVDGIMERYQKESETSRKVGNFLVILYIVVSLGLIVFI